MTPPREPAPGAADANDLPPEQPPPAPDEDGPHDVPDDAVIEKTLPSSRPPGGRGDRSG